MTANPDLPTESLCVRVGFTPDGIMQTIVETEPDNSACVITITLDVSRPNAWHDFIRVTDILTQEFVQLMSEQTGDIAREAGLTAHINPEEALTAMREHLELQGLPPDEIETMMVGMDSFFPPA